MLLGIMTKARKTTDQKIDELAVAVTRGFEAVDRRFDEIHKIHQVFIDRFDNLDNQVGQIRLITNSLVKMIADRDREMRTMDLRLRRVERRLGLIST